jgi:hypothetical protein
MSYYLSKAGETLRAQIDARWPGRERASDGWIGDSSHQASQDSDHNPDWSSGGVVRAIDVDSSLGGKTGWNSTDDSWALANQLRLAMLAGERRLSYIIAWDNARGGDYIASMNSAYQPLGAWRPYTGNSHQNHLHLSFTPAGDKDGSPFDIPALATDKGEPEMDEYLEGSAAAKAAYAKDTKIGTPPDGKGKYFRAGWNDVRWAVGNLKAKDGKAGPKGEPGPAGPPGASHSHAKVSVCGPAIETP